MEHWSEEFVSEIIFSKYCSFDSCGDAINPKLGQKGPKLVFHAPMLIERWKSIVKGNLRWSIRFWKHYHKIFKFWLPMVTSSTEKWVKEAQIGTLCSNDDRKIKTKIKRYLEVNYSFMKPFFQNLKSCLNMVMTSTRNWVEKGPKLVSQELMVTKDENQK